MSALEERLFRRLRENVVLELLFLLRLVFVVQLVLKPFLRLHFRNYVAQVEALSIRDLFLANLLVFLDLDELVLHGTFHDKGSLLVITYCLLLYCNHLGPLRLSVIHLIFHLAHA